MSEEFWFLDEDSEKCDKFNNNKPFKSLPKCIICTDKLSVDEYKVYTYDKTYHNSQDLCVCETHWCDCMPKRLPSLYIRLCSCKFSSICNRCNKNGLCLLCYKSQITNTC